jgi:FtsP/CotA-like multicopper oxidase with cupredoxin domain
MLSATGTPSSSTYLRGDGSWATVAAQTYPGAGIANSTGSAWGTSYTTSGSGTVVALNNTPTLTNPTITNYVETPYSANSSTAITLALTNGTVQIITLTGNATITMPTAVSGKSFTLLLKQDATGSRTVTWSTVSWPGGTAPTITSTASKMDKYVFISDGTSWFGSTAGQNYT